MTRLAKALQRLEVPAESADKLSKFSALFVKWNKAINLSAARSEADVHDHIIDCLHALPHLRSTAASGPGTLLDVGAGGGLPSVVVAICLPATQVTALEPLHKKHAFLRTAARELSLSNLEPLAERVADHPLHDYDAAISRATFDLREWLLSGLTRIRIGGRVLGFEAIPRDDLPAGTQRHPYELDGKTRAIVVLGK